MAWKAKKHDKFWRLAKEQGYRSRAAFKLVQLNKKYDFLGSAKVLIDLCAAPGGWLQVAAKHMPVSSIIVGVDILPIRPIRGVVCLTQDITTQQCRTELKTAIQGFMADVVVHDGAPNVGGSTWTKDAFGQIELVLHSMKLATEFLREGGTFVTKIFRSQDYNALLWSLKQFFKKIEVTKPSASRSTSAEIYAVCQGYLAPRKYDPRLLESSTLFKQVDEKKTESVLNKKSKQRRHREGYETDKQLLYQWAPITAFIDAEEPVSLLGQYNEFKWDDKAKVYLDHVETTDDIKDLVKDLKVLNRKDFQALLRWQKKMVKHKTNLLKEEKGAEVKEEKKEKTEEEKVEFEEKKLEKQLNELQSKLTAKQKKTRRKKNEEKAKQRKRLALNANSSGVGEEAEEGLFHLSSIGDKDSLSYLHKTGEEGADHLAEISDEERTVEPEPEFPTTDDPVEDNLNYLYQQYLTARNLKRKTKREKLGLEDDEKPEGLDEELEPSVEENAEKKSVNPLMVDFEDNLSSAQSAVSRWFGRDVFSDIGKPEAKAPPIKPENIKSIEADSEDDLQEQDNEDNDEVDNQNEKQSSKTKVITTAKENGSGNLNSKSIDPSVEIDKEGRQRVLIPATDPTINVFLQGISLSTKRKRGNEEGAKEGAKGGAVEEPEGFEEVRMDETESDISSDEDAKAETLAIATAMIRKKARLEMIDKAYNRYVFDDPKNLPVWFTDEESSHNKPALPVTKAEVDQFKDMMKQINARPMKKIAEAKARKKHKTAKRWEKIKNNAEVIANTEGVAPGEKIRQISKLYSKVDKRKGKQDKVYVVSRKGGGSQKAKKTSKRGKVKMVDKRLKKDARAQKRIAKKRGNKPPPKPKKKK